MSQVFCTGPVAEHVKSHLNQSAAA